MSYNNDVPKNPANTDTSSDDLRNSEESGRLPLASASSGLMMPVPVLNMMPIPR